MNNWERLTRNASVLALTLLHGQYWTIETDGNPIQALLVEQSDISGA